MSPKIFSRFLWCEQNLEFFFKKKGKKEEKWRILFLRPKSSDSNLIFIVSETHLNKIVYIFH